MLVLVDGHGERLEIRLCGGAYDEFKERVNFLAELVGGVARYFRFSIRPPHFFDIPPQGAMFKLRTALKMLPCRWETELRLAGQTIGELLLAERDCEAVWACAPILTPQVKLVERSTPPICIVTLHPLPIQFPMVYPIPDLEVTDDLEQMLPTAQVGGVSADMEGLSQVRPDALTMLYRGYLRYYLRQMTPGLRLFLARVVIYHALVDKSWVKEAPPPSTVTAPPNHLVNKLLLLADTPELKWERWIALRLCYEANPNVVELHTLRNDCPNIDEMVLVSSVIKQHFT